MNIVPFISVGDLYFTDTREALREKIGEEYQTGIDDLGGYKSYYDFYQGRDLLIYFDEQDVVTAFEFFSPEPEYRDIDILSEGYDKLIGLFKVFDPGITIDEGGFDAPELGLRVHTPDSEEGADVPESVLVYRKDYYEE